MHFCYGRPIHFFSSVIRWCPPCSSAGSPSPVEHQGQGLGRALIFDAAIRTDRLRIGAFAIIVDAKDDRAAAFYRSNRFALIPGESRRLFVPVATSF